MSGHAQCLAGDRDNAYPRPETGGGSARERWTRVKKGTAKQSSVDGREGQRRPSKRRQHSGICGRKPRLPVVRPSPVDKYGWATTLAANDHRPSPPHLDPIDESWCYADPPTPRWHTPPTLVETQALRWTPSSTQIAGLHVQVRVRAPSTVLFLLRDSLGRQLLQAC